MGVYEWREYYRGSGNSADYFYVEIESGIVVAKILGRVGPAPYTVNIKGCGDTWEFIDLHKAKAWVEGKLK